MKIRDLKIEDVLAEIRASTTTPRRLRRLGYCCEVRYQVANLDGWRTTARAWWDAAAEAYRRAG